MIVALLIFFHYLDIVNIVITLTLFLTVIFYASAYTITRISESLIDSKNSNIHIIVSDIIYTIMYAHVHAKIAWRYHLMLFHQWTRLFHKPRITRRYTRMILRKFFKLIWMWMKITTHSKISRRYTTLLRESYINSNPLLHGDGLELLKLFTAIMISSILSLFISYFIILEMLQEMINFELLFKRIRFVLSIIMFSVFVSIVIIKIYEWLLDHICWITKIIVDLLIDWLVNTVQHIVYDLINAIHELALDATVSIILPFLKYLWRSSRVDRRYGYILLISYMNHAITFLNLFLHLTYERACYYWSIVRYYWSIVRYYWLIIKPFMTVLMSIYLMFTYLPVWTTLRVIYTCIYIINVVLYTLEHISYKIYNYIKFAVIMCWAMIAYAYTCLLFNHIVSITWLLTKEILYIVRCVAFVLVIALSPVVELVSIAICVNVVKLYWYSMGAIFMLLYVHIYTSSDERVVESLERWRLQNVFEYWQEPNIISVYDRDTWDKPKLLFYFFWRFYTRQRWQLRNSLLVEEWLFFDYKDEDFLISRNDVAYIWRSDPVSGAAEYDYEFFDLWYILRKNYLFRERWELKVRKPYLEYVVDFCQSWEMWGKPCQEVDETEYGENRLHLVHLDYANIEDEESTFKSLSAIGKRLRRTKKEELTIEDLIMLKTENYEELEICQITGEFLPNKIPEVLLQKPEEELSELSMYQNIYKEVYNKIEGEVFKKVDLTHEEIIYNLKQEVNEKYITNAPIQVSFHYKCFNPFDERECMDMREDLLHDEDEVLTKLEEFDKVEELKINNLTVNGLTRDILESQNEWWSYENMIFKMKYPSFNQNTNYGWINNPFNGEIGRRWDMDPDASLAILTTIGQHGYGLLNWEQWVMLDHIDSLLGEVIHAPMNIVLIFIQTIGESIVDDFWYYYFTIRKYHHLWIFTWWWMWFWEEDLKCWKSPWEVKEEEPLLPQKQLDIIFGIYDNHQHYINRLLAIEEGLRDEEYPKKVWPWGKNWWDLYVNVDIFL